MVPDIETALSPSGKKIRIVCAHCGSTDVVVDSFSKWDEETQEFVTTFVSDKGHYCNDCDGECRIKEIPLE